MLDFVIATRFDKRMGSGRTKPILLACERNDGAESEVVAKLSKGCDRGIGGLVAEAIAAMLAADLGLPIPEPFLVHLEPEFVALIPDLEIRNLAMSSSSIAFGSEKLPPGFSSWPVNKPVTAALRDVAAEIFAFDAIIANPDRRTVNPNCQSNGRSLAIFDHELAFLIGGIIGWRPPWETGALENLRPTTANAHVFFAGLQSKPVNLARFAGAWASISESRLQQYQAALPPEWADDKGLADRALVYISQVRENIQPAIAEIARVLI
jgi:hypothetical protein